MPEKKSGNSAGWASQKKNSFSAKTSIAKSSTAKTSIAKTSRNQAAKSSKTNRPTVIRGNSKSATPKNIKELSSAVLQEKENGNSTLLSVVDTETKSSLNNSRYRIMAIAGILAFLIFAIGVQVGNSNNKTLVDDAIETILDTGAQKLDRGALQRAAIEGALKATGDEWANYFPNSALKVLEEQNSSTFTGIGVWLTKSRGGQVKISSIQNGSPASRSGLLVGDQILEVNGTDVRGASLTSVIALIRGDLGSRIELLVSRDDKRILATLSSKKVAVRNVEASQVSKDIGLIKIANFGTGTADDLKAAISKLNYKSGLIIDLRDNPGGLIEEAVKVAEIFIGNGVVVSYQVNDAERLFKVVNPKPITVPVILIINRNTASAAEILAGAFQDRNRGVVIGERSYGKGSVQEFKTLEDGSKIELTVALYRTPSGRVIDEVGITPDLEVADSEIGQKALQVLGGLSSLISKAK